MIVTVKQAQRLYQDITTAGMRQRTSVVKTSTGPRTHVQIGFWKPATGWVTLAKGTAPTFNEAFIQAMRLYDERSNAFATTPAGQDILRAAGR